jgi:hypothetical protein
MPDVVRSRGWATAWMQVFEDEIPELAGVNVMARTGGRHKTNPRYETRCIDGWVVIEVDRKTCQATIGIDRLQRKAEQMVDSQLRTIRAREKGSNGSTPLQDN